jgi:hypothetical protein
MQPPSSPRKPRAIDRTGMTQRLLVRPRYGGWWENLPPATGLLKLKREKIALMQFKPESHRLAG